VQGITGALGPGISSYVPDKLPRGNYWSGVERQQAQAPSLKPQA